MTAQHVLESPARIACQRRGINVQVDEDKTAERTSTATGDKRERTFVEPRDAVTVACGP